MANFVQGLADHFVRVVLPVANGPQVRCPVPLTGSQLGQSIGSPHHRCGMLFKQHVKIAGMRQQPLKPTEHGKPLFAQM